MRNVPSVGDSTQVTAEMRQHCTLVQHAGRPERSRIVENQAALVGELGRSFVREIEEAAGPSPE